MTTYQMVRRFTIAFLLAVILAACLFISKAQAQDDGGGEIVVPRPKSFCETLEPWGYWFFFWGCHLHYQVTFTVIQTPLPIVVPVIVEKK